MEHFMETKHRANNLHYHRTSVVPMEECKAIYEESRTYGYKNTNVGNASICIQNIESFDFTYGDPLVADNIIYGIASWTGGSKDYPNVYTKVFSHRKWIQDNSILPETTN